MTAQLIDGNALSRQLRTEVAQRAAALKARGTTPGLAVVLVGDNPASQVYVRNKVKACEDSGLHSVLEKYEADMTEAALLARVQALNNDPAIHGILVQLPLPKHIDAQKVIEAISPAKDVDGFHIASAGALMTGMPGFWPCTPYGCLYLLKKTLPKLEGLSAIVIGRSNIVGKPMATLMMQKSYPGDCTVTVCHSRSKNLKEMCLSADIIIVALGVPEFLKGDMVKEGAVIVDVGTTRMPSSVTKSGFKLTGDVLFNEVAPKCSYITPVPGGVGPMTIISLMRNTLLAGKKAIYK